MIRSLIQWFRVSTIAWLVFIAAAVYGLYTVKYRVLAIQREIASVESELQQEQENLRVVAAEWAYLTRPERLQALVTKHTSLVPVQGIQVMEVSTLPFPPAEQTDHMAAVAKSTGMMPVSATMSAQKTSVAQASIPED
jgi:hypothetical protein